MTVPSTRQHRESRPEPEDAAIRERGEATAQEVQIARDSVIASLKEIVSIVMGLALTNTVVVLVTGGHYSSIRSLRHVPLSTTLYSIVLVATIVRFYHGNMRHIEHVHGRVSVEDRYARRDPPLRTGLGIDFIVVLVQSMLFAVESFYASRRQEFLTVFVVLLILDITWFLINLREDPTSEVVKHQRNWMFNNFSALVLIGFSFYKFGISHRDVYLDIGAGIMAVNTIVDFVISWTFYFPAFHLATAGSPEQQAPVPAAERTSA
jgi:hypothetical protein